MKKISAGQVIRFLRQNYIDRENSGHEPGGCEGFYSYIDYKSNTLTWIKSYEQYLELLGKDISVEWDKVSLIVVDKKTYDSIPYINAIICSNPKQAFYMILVHFYSDCEVKESV